MIVDSPPFTKREYDTSPIVVADDEAFVVASDGILYAIDSRT
jgi:hypothetical protein